MIGREVEITPELKQVMFEGLIRKRFAPSVERNPKPASAIEEHFQRGMSLFEQIIDINTMDMIQGRKARLSDRAVELGMSLADILHEEISQITSPKSKL